MLVYVTAWEYTLRVENDVTEPIELPTDGDVGEEPDEPQPPEDDE